MARFRILRRPSVSNCTEARYDIQRRSWTGWHTIDFYFTMQDAENAMEDRLSEEAEVIEWEVMRVYD